MSDHLSLREILELRKSELGVLSDQDAVQRDTQSIVNMPSPGPDCLEDHELLAFAKDESALSPEQVDHIRGCNSCRQLAEDVRDLQPGCEKAKRMGQLLSGG